MFQLVQVFKYNTCPTCKTTISHTVSSEINLQNNYIKSDDTFLFKYYELITELEIKYKKIMIVFDSDHEMSKHLTTFMDQKNFVVLKSCGATSVTKAIRKSKSYPACKFIFVNCATVNNGINMEHIDVILWLKEFRNDTESAQMIGRSQRPGPLEIIYMKRKLIA